MILYIYISEGPTLFLNFFLVHINVRLCFDHFHLVRKRSVRIDMYVNLGGIYVNIYIIIPTYILIFFG